MTTVTTAQIKIPTYQCGKPEIHPMFLERRINQGASGRVYPYPLIDSIFDIKEDKEYTAVFLENEYLKIMILPELGGRVQMAYDKAAKRHFVYYNTVIKPALIGFLGPWISGGIEFNWPLHHRPSTYMPLDYTVTENEDGSKTLWVSENEKLFRTRASVGYTIYPGKAFLKLSVKIYNGTELPQNFLWWANIAVKSDKKHQHVFPPDVKGVYFHARGDSGRYPVMRGEFCGMDFFSGVDVSFNENIPNPTSYMALPSKYSFCGAYTHEERGGILHIADAGISPGKKLFTWGNSNFARGWMRNLTDTDGPYLELMAGVFTDNQPDFAWLSPFEEKRFDEYFLPYSELGVVQNANEKGALKCGIDEDSIELGLYATEHSEWEISVYLNDTVYYVNQMTLNPEKIWTHKIDRKADISEQSLYVCIRDMNGDIVFDWRPETDEEGTVPEVSAQVKLPKDIRDNDELFLTGQHIEQYIHATYNPEDYYLEALRRDRTDSRCNMAMGRLMLRRGNFKEAIGYLEASWTKYTMRNSNPYDGEISYLMGLCYEYLGAHEKAYVNYYKSTWNSAWQSQGFMSLARLECRENNLLKATDFINSSLSVNGLNRKARHISVVLARLKSDLTAAKHLIDKWLSEDPTDHWMLYENYLLNREKKSLESFLTITRQNNYTFLELAIDYIKLGLLREANTLLALLEKVEDPMVWYYQAFCLKDTDRPRAKELIHNAESMPLTPYFPNRLEDIMTLKYAIDVNPGSKALYLLGNLFYDKRQYTTAMECWNKSLQIEENSSAVLRNLAIGNFNKFNKISLAREQMESAVKLDPDNARFVAELNEIYINTCVSPNERLDFLEKHKSMITMRDDLKLEYVKVTNLCRSYDAALTLMKDYAFHPWECKEGFIGNQFVISNIALGVEALSCGEYNKALQHFNDGMTLPKNLGEEKLCSATDNDLKYFAGIACEKLGDTEKARQYYTDALVCDTRIYPALSLAAVSLPDYIFFRGMAFKNLKDQASAEKCFNKLIEYGIENDNTDVRFHFLEIGNVVSTSTFEEDIDKRNRAYCLYLQGLGELGHGRIEHAKVLIESVLDIDPNHSRASLIKNLLDTGIF